MNLHRTGNQGQWVDTPPQERNIWQKMAARTNGVVAPANFVSVVGGLLVLSGLKDISQGKTKRGITKIFFGRVGGDLGDGATAELTKTKSPTGEATDASVDKVLAAASLATLTKIGALPVYAAVPIAAQNITSASTSIKAKRQGTPIHPSEEGKLTTALQWFAMGTYPLAAVARKADMPDAAKGLEAAGFTALAAGTILGVQAVRGYRRDLQTMQAEVTDHNLPGPVQTT